MTTALASPTWTPERLAELRMYAAQGLTAGQIAHRMRPVTELAIIGRCAREGIELGAKPPPATRNRRRREAAAIDEADPMFGVAPPPREDAWRPLAGREPILLVNTEPHHCTWPIGDSDDVAHWRCCGASKGAGLPYCPEHTALAYEAGRYRRGGAIVRDFMRYAERYAR